MSLLLSHTHKSLYNTEANFYFALRCLANRKSTLHSERSMAHSEVVNTNTSRHAIFQALIWTRHFQHFQTRINNLKRISNFSSLFKNCGLWILPWCKWSFIMSNPKLLTANTILIFSPCTFHVQFNVSQDQITVNRWMCHRIKSQFGGSLHYYVILSLLSPWTGDCMNVSQD